jgi:hypothetical protein
MAHYNALRLARSRPFAQTNHLRAFESILVHEACLPVGSLSAIVYALPRSL